MATLWAAVVTAVPALVAIYFANRVGIRQSDILGKQSDWNRAWCSPTPTPVG